MTDLRTRIAAALGDEMFKRDAYTEYGTDGEPGQWERVDGHINLTALADAVIRELETGYVLVPKSRTLARNAFKYGEHYGI